MIRTKEREQAFILTFEHAFNSDMTIEDICQMAIESEFIKPSDFSIKLATLVSDNKDEIDNKINEFAIGWTAQRLSKVALAILRIAICEIMYMEDIPQGVSINEAVELAKEYAGKEDSAFINGILGSIARAE